MKPGRIHGKNPREIWDLSDLPVPLNRNCTSSTVGNSRVSWRCEPSWGLITCRQWRVATTGCSLYRVETPQSGGDCGEGRAALSSLLCSAIYQHYVRQLETVRPTAWRHPQHGQSSPSSSSPGLRGTVGRTVPPTTWRTVRCVTTSTSSSATSSPRLWWLPWK